MAQYTNNRTIVYHNVKTMNGEKGVLLQSRVINPMLLFYLFDRIEELYAKSEYHRRFITELHTIIDRLIG